MANAIICCFTGIFVKTLLVNAVQKKKTIQHIVEECPLTKFQQGFSKLHLLTEDALNWLQQIRNIIDHNYFVNFEF
jgi:hypothetical protein